MSALRWFAVAAVVLATSACVPPRHGPVQAGPASGGDLVYVGDDRGRIHALAADGARRWTYDFGAVLAHEVAGATPDVAIVEISSESSGGVAVLYRSETGATTGASYAAVVGVDGVERWHGSVVEPSDASRPMAVGRDVYLTGADGALHAYALASGATLWSATVTGASPGSPHVGGDGTVYVRGVNGRVHAFTPDGAERWVFDPGT